MYWQRFKRPEDCFWEMVDIKDSGSCWPWLGAVTGKTRRGHFRNETAPRFAWRSAYGEIPEGNYVCHKCDNPNCVNPTHLFIGSQKENIADRIRKGRPGAPGARPGSLHPLAKLTAEQVTEIIATAKGGARYIDIAAKFKISKSQVGRIVNGQRWKILKTEGDLVEGQTIRAA